MAQGRIPQLTPDSQFPEEALKESIQKAPKNEVGGGGYLYTLSLANVGNKILPWGRNIRARDRQIRDFWPTESYLAGAVATVAFRNAVFQWEIEGGGERVEQAVTDILTSAIAGDSFGWVPFSEKFSQDLYTQDNGAFIELIRDEGVDANSRFRGPLAPVLGVAHLDSNQCIRTGDPEFPVVYIDRQGVKHKLRWYQVIPFSDFPSAIEKMNGVGVCAVSRVLKMAQAMYSVINYKDEKVSGRHYKQLHFVSGVSRMDIKDEMARGQEEANNQGLVNFIAPSILASLDPEKPVSTATIDLASLPDGFDFDQEMKWYISALALDFGVDYQEFAPLPGGNIGSSQQSMILHRKGSGKGPAVMMRMLAEAFRNYGLLPRGSRMRFNDRDEQEALERQEVRTKAIEEMAIAVSRKILTPQAAANSMIRRGIWDNEDIKGITDIFWKAGEMGDQADGQTVGDRGGNTIREDSGRQDTGEVKETVGGRLKKAYENYIEVVREERKQNHEQNMAITLSKAFSSAIESLRKDQQPIIVNLPEPQVVIHVPQGPAPQVTFIAPAQPAPIVNSYNELKLPEPKGAKVIRDASGKMVGIEPDEE